MMYAIRNKETKAWHRRANAIVIYRSEVTANETLSYEKNKDLYEVVPVTITERSE